MLILRLRLVSSVRFLGKRAARLREAKRREAKVSDEQPAQILPPLNMFEELSLYLHLCSSVMLVS